MHEAALCALLPRNLPAVANPREAYHLGDVRKLLPLRTAASQASVTNRLVDQLGGALLRAPAVANLGRRMCSMWKLKVCFPEVGKLLLVQEVIASSLGMDGETLEGLETCQIFLQVKEVFVRPGHLRISPRLRCHGL
eukprot:TRINITY_DN12503_c0_g1_i3.p2 TRINITY_DN12503_c0_g1~~TRINITY_DN12503_c0_g1_i3.p2  ORF type:complete len:137 (-),score=12.27 TRINITY_DN12503_c0_g1_i3:76-486(-)